MPLPSSARTVRQGHLLKPRLYLPVIERNQPHAHRQPSRSLTFHVRNPNDRACFHLINFGINCCVLESKNNNESDINGARYKSISPNCVIPCVVSCSDVRAHLLLIISFWLSSSARSQWHRRMRCRRRSIANERKGAECSYFSVDNRLSRR